MIYRNTHKWVSYLIFNTPGHKGLSIRCSRPLCSSQSTGGTSPSRKQCANERKVQRKGSYLAAEAVT